MENTDDDVNAQQHDHDTHHSSPKKTKKQVWLDCDPGHDDVFAILLAGYSESVHLLGISTVACNQTVECTTENAQRAVHFYGLDGIDVVKGQAKPLLKDAVQGCPEIHGESGLDNINGEHTLPPIDVSRSPVETNSRIHGGTVVEANGVIRMYRAIEQSYRDTCGDKVTIVATGALTNVALLLLMFGSEVQEMVDMICLMGGTLHGPGNTGPVSEFNIQTDPHAFHVVITNTPTIRVVMVPLEVTHTALCTDEILHRIGSIGSGEQIEKTLELLTYFAKTYKTVFGFEHPPLHDPCAVAYVIAPEIFATECHYVCVEMNNPLSYGQTIVDVWKQISMPENVEVCVKMDTDAFWDMMIDAIHKACGMSHIKI